MKNVLFLFCIISMLSTACVVQSGDNLIIVDRPVVNSFTSIPSSISSGQSSTLNWEVTGANTVYIDQGVGTVATMGTTSVSPIATTVYILTASNSFGSSTARTQVTVNGGNATPAVSQKPVINYFLAEPSTVNAGSSTNIKWSISGADSIEITPEIAQPESEMSINVYPAATTSYNLTAINSYGSVTASIVVNVTGTTPVLSGNERILVSPLIISESGSVMKNSSNYAKLTAICAGDDAGNQANRAFISFDISNVPPSAVITKVMLDLNPTIKGNPSYVSGTWGNMGALEIYQYQFGQSDTLGRSDYEASVPVLDRLQLDGVSSTPITVDVTFDREGKVIVQQLLNGGQNRLQFRVQFFTSTNWNSAADMVCLDNATLSTIYKVP